MSTKSMTGFARVEGQTNVPDMGDIEWHWELKSVNSRGLDARFRTPPILNGLDIEVKRRLTGQLTRGNLSGLLEIRLPGGGEGLRVNRPFLEELIGLAGDYENQENLGASDLATYLSVRGVIEAAEVRLSADHLALLRLDVLAGFDTALETLNQNRAVEGAAMETVIRGLLDDLSSQYDAAKASDGARIETIKARFLEKLHEIMDHKPDAVSADRLEHEIALLAVKADIREELDRLDAHIAAARALLESAGPIGRKFDFLSQELNREANTICSKSGDMDLTQTGLAMKATIDQLREQIQNVE